ncbi:hypothetical protein HNP37_004349 [Flavobacterium nitrogenifigens]|uniref:Uncharacterized protein n=2 Tax=Flavobacterium TaxID=237 RepID=A0A7W7J130_9FLAO|nr:MULTISPECIES: hypothetical protein [Flavobacterium]MBB4804262.1 hypothetical protein [Flavobacterium nitrogenifigens]MBB6389342.1 hypothetical protein [Flavobacterium notoginsengisoli]
MSQKLDLGSVVITLTEGIQWADKYRKDMTTEEGRKKQVDGYLIPLESLKLVMDQDIQAVRAYKGINKAGEQTLILVGAKWDAEKGIYVDVFKEEKGEEGVEGGVPLVYDGTRPVPPYGDPESPLNP